MIKLIVILAALAGLQANADFQKVDVRAKPVRCRFVPAHQGEPATVLIEGQRREYLPYEKVRDLTVNGCENAVVAGHTFITISYDAVIDRGSLLKIRVFEIVLSQNETLTTVRSEVVDQVNLRGDRADTAFRLQLGHEWGRDSRDGLPMMKFESRGRGEAETTIVKLNPRNSWFEDADE